MATATIQVTADIAIKAFTDDQISDEYDRRFHVDQAFIELADEIFRRHDARHIGPVRFCRDPICAAYIRTQL